MVNERLNTNVLMTNAVSTDKSKFQIIFSSATNSHAFTQDSLNTYISAV